jgi:hypothetical protein
MLEEIKELNWNEDILKKYDIKSIQVINEPNLEPTIYINLNNGIRLDSNLHRYEITKIVSSIKSDNRDNKINTILNV